MMLRASSSALPRVGRRASVPMPSRPRRAATVAKAVAEKSALAKLSDAVGMPTDDGIFGFTPFSEMWVGRWSMLGFVSSIVVEFATGQGTLQQVGLASPSTPLLAAMIAIFGGATVVGAVATVQQMVTKKMPLSQMKRYRSFLGLTKEDDFLADSTARSMKSRPGFTTPGFDEAAIEAVRREGMPADRFLALDNNEAASGEPSTSTSSTPAPAPASSTSQMTMEQLYGVNDTAYARSVEVANGRAAMLGFLAAILVEAATGDGILQQLVMYGKLSGILGVASAF